MEISNYFKFQLQKLLSLCVLCFFGRLVTEVLCALFGKNRKESQGECIVSPSSEKRRDLKANDGWAMVRNMLG